ncbi:MAG: 30S ribosomal protein S6 [Oscillospiraceae bacterium]|nr:30S ribosomal protein S6 [Oscillospiraceae bacterium]
MAKITAKYETIFIVSPKLDEESTAATVERFKSLIEANATIGEVDEWGKRRLAYEIDDEREGYYVLINFTSGTEFPAELDRIYKITDGIMRSIIICKD